MTYVYHTVPSFKTSLHVPKFCIIIIIIITISTTVS